MWTIREMKERGKAAFKANYWPCVLVAFLMGLFTAAASVSSRSDSSAEMQSALQNADKTTIAIVLGASTFAIVIGLLLKIFLVNPLRLGGAHFFIQNIEAGPAPVAAIKAGFQNYGHNFLVLLLRDVYLLLWTLLFLVPGLIKAYSYYMVPYILAEHPELSAKEVISLSREMMAGNKWQAFKLDLSFIGWLLLGALTFGLVDVFWAAPYMESAQAALYLRLRDEV